MKIIIMASFNSEHSASTQPDEDKAQEEDQEPPPSPRKELARQQKERRAAYADACAVKRQEAALNRGFERIQEFFGKDPRPGQRAVLGALYESKDVILRARTGFGKSLIFYGFLLMQPVDSKRDVTIIFTPLEGLGQQMMDDLNSYFEKRPKDDVLKVRSKTMKKGACFLDGSSTRDDIFRVGQGDFRWVFITPEKAKSAPVIDMFKDQAFQAKVNLITVDEAHLVDEWYVACQSSDH
jgi:superfamily II DNA helicase RecQ